MTIFASSKLTHSRIDFQHDPLIKSIQMMRQNINVENLLKKARILMPKSAVLFGVVDEDGVLEEDEIFVRIKRDNNKVDAAALKKLSVLNRSQSLKNLISLAQRIDYLPYTLQGKVVVTRSPCSHPGDIRILQAVDLSRRNRRKHLT